MMLSPRSGRKRKAWGVSPRYRFVNGIEPAKRAEAVARFAGYNLTFTIVLGLTPQALCSHLLRRLREESRRWLMQSVWGF